MTNCGMALGYSGSEELIGFKKESEGVGLDPKTVMSTILLVKLSEDPEIKAEVESAAEAVRPILRDLLQAIRERTPKLEVAVKELLPKEE